MTHHLIFDDNKLAPVLYGEQNVHLQKIENALGLNISCRGNEIFIKGDDDKVQQAKNILNTLWDQLKNGEHVTPQTVDSALRFLFEETNDSDIESLNNFKNNPVTIVTKKKTVRARSPNQAHYVSTMEKHELVFGIGPAGTGKTYLAVAMAVSMLERGQVERIILTRPAVEAGENLGFLPGEMKEKMDPYMRPLYDALHDTLGTEKVTKKIASEEIEIAPLAFMRGRSLNNAFIILDEGQNATSIQMLMFLTRLGENSRMVVTGDPAQTDLPHGQKSGLIEASRILANVNDIDFIHFKSEDIVRHHLVAKIVQAYDAKKDK